MKRIQQVLIGTFVLFMTITIHAQEKYWSRAFADAIMERHPGTINDLTNKGWEYSNSIVLIGIEKLYYETGHKKYLNYIQDYVDLFVNSKGDISFDPNANNLDHLHPGWLCITLYEETGEEKYKKAADNIRAEFDNQPRNPSGGFWHKQRYPNQMWADGIYMAEPFLIRYGTVFDDLEYAADEATQQAILFFDHAYDSTTHMLYHGWDETKSAYWADAETGRSPIVWSRAFGWYMMAMVDILDYLPEDHENYDRMIEILQALSEGIKNTQDTETGLWYQVVDKGELTDNWHETSGSSMFVYALKKAVDNGYISNDYLTVAEKGWEGVQSEITLDSQERPIINQFVGGLGIRGDYETYISQDIVSTPNSRHPHGYCAVLLAAGQMEFPLPRQFSLSSSISGQGEIEQSLEQDYIDTAAVVTLKAVPDEGWEFDSWKGDIDSKSNPLEIQLDSNISIEAKFVEIELTDIRSTINSTFKVYPTLVDQELKILLTDEIAFDIKLDIIDTMGRKMSPTHYSIHSSSNNEILLSFSSELTPGIYHLLLQGRNEEFMQQFIIK